MPLQRTKQSAHKKVAKAHKRINKQSGHINYLKSMMKALSKNLYYGFREANEVGDGAGKITIKNDQTTGTELPLHIYSLNNVVNDGAAISAGWYLKSNGYDFTSLGNVEFMGCEGQNDASQATIDGLGKNILYSNYHDIRLMLWGKSTRKAVYKIMLVQLLDEELDPNINTTTTKGNTQEKRQMLYVGKLLRPIMLNPVIREVHTKQLESGYKILWQKTYKLDETLSTEDEAQHKLVKIFRQRNRNINYQESPNLALSTISADAVNYASPNESPTGYPTHSKNNLFLIIIANNSLEDDSSTYDINIKSKYTLLGNVG